MKRILGLDLGTNSIGWALVNEKENEQEKSSIIKLGVRVNPLTVDEQQNFEQGKPITTNVLRREKRSMRRNLQRYKLRRAALIKILKANGFITDETPLTETNKVIFETYRLRAKAATEQVSLEEFARILLMINKKRGYKSNRKAVSDADGTAIDGMDTARYLYDNELTPGQYVFSLLEKGKKHTPDFYRSDLQGEFDKIWNFQRQFYPEQLTSELREELYDKNESQTWAIIAKAFRLVGIKSSKKGFEQKKEQYQWRVEALNAQTDPEKLAVVLQKINGQCKNSSGYLGHISDRSKELYFKKQTVGQFLMNRLDENPNNSLKNLVFYRQDYLDEFERLWETQARFHPQLTPELKREIRDVVIFYQRALKSQKGLISLCEFENHTLEVIQDDGRTRQKTVGMRVIPKSSLLFQEFKIWQILNNIKVTGLVVTDENQRPVQGCRFLTPEEKDKLYAELTFKEKLSKSDVLKLLFRNPKGVDLNFKEHIEGNHTMCAFFKAYQTIIDQSGHGEHDFKKMNAPAIMDLVESVFATIGLNKDILRFNPLLPGKQMEKQDSYRLWHLLYSFAGDNSKSGQEKLLEKLQQLCSCNREYAKVLAGITFKSDYGSLSAKAIRKIMPHLMEGHEYSEACGLAGYRHSKHSLTKQEIQERVLKDKLELLPRNSLRNPVVEKILNQMINVVNMVVDTYGKPDEIRIELARELKKSAKEREDMTKAINSANREHESIRKILQAEFNLSNPSRNDIVRYKLYMELKDNGFKTLYSNTYIPQERLFSKEFDIEHIIPQARLFDDSFSNKTLEARHINIEKSDATARDYVESKYGQQGLEEYTKKVENLFKSKVISKSKRDKLLMCEADIPSGFIERDLRNTQYIAKKACEILEEIVREVVPTTGSVTDRLRQDWQLVDVMQELNWEKYDALGMTYTIKDKDGRVIRKIKDWTKRNDHRHHAMDALTIAFTKRCFIQYLNNLNARGDKSGSIYAIEKKELERINGHLRFVPPIPLDEFRAQAKKHLQDTLVSIKSKTKVVTRNVNTSKGSNGIRRKKVQLTPRGQLHNETFYGKISRYATREEKVGSSFTAEKIATVANMRYRMALLERLQQFNGDPQKAFTGSNSLEKNPIFLNASHTLAVPGRVKTVTFEEVFTTRKDINHDFKADTVAKVIDVHVRQILQKRLDEYGGSATKAFSNLDENPIWLNKEKGISIKRVTITGIGNGVALHDKRDHLGRVIMDENGQKQPSDYVSTSNNHHVAIFLDEKGTLQEHIVSFYEATERARQGLPVIDKQYRKSEGWQYLFSMKQNEYVVFPNTETGFNPNEVDLLNPDNYHLISPNLFRVQKLATKDYTFRHHLETKVDDKKELKGIIWKRIRSLVNLMGIVKVRVNHIGHIVAVGEP